MPFRKKGCLLLKVLEYCFRVGPGCDRNSFNTSIIQSCTDGFMYDTKVYQQSVVSRFDLVCGQEFAGMALVALSLLGIFVGCVLGGFLADKFGRKTTLIGGVTLTIPQLFLAGFSPNYWIFATLR